MLHRAFGYEQLERTEPSDLAELLTYAGPQDGVMASILTMEAYDTTYGLCSHDNDNAPLSLITLHPKENFLAGGRLQATMRAFRKHRVGTHFQLSFAEFLKYPRHVTRMILKECEAAEREESERARSVLDKVGNYART